MKGKKTASSPARARKTDTKTAATSAWRRVGRFILLTANVLAAAWLLVAAYGGCIDPRTWALPAIVGMTMPVAAAVALLMLVADLLCRRRLALIPVLAIVAAWPMVSKVIPLHIGTEQISAEDEAKSFTLLTYNVYDFWNVGDNTYPGGINPTVSYILQTDADIVCLQEAEYLCEYKPTHFTAEQADSLRARYPYISLNGTGLAVLSRYPLRLLHSDFEFDTPGGGDMAAYEVTLAGRRVALVNVHLRSFGLTDSDKELYGELTHLRAKRQIGRVKSTLYAKVADAARDRARQADQLVRLIAKYGGENVIVTGDFNDVPGCYTAHALADAGMKEVYPAVGFGYMPTYNRNRFYFTIDHIFWRGCMRPLSLERGNLKCSDHYPLLVTFVLEGGE